jgi:hypothetical protein
MKNRKPANKPPEVWFRTTPLGRQEIIAEVTGLPDHYTQGLASKAKGGGAAKHAGARVPVNPGITKGVLRCLATWDEPGAKFFRSNENIAHWTGYPLGSLNKAIRVLKEIKILRKITRGLGKTSYSELDWDVIERYRRRYRPKPRGFGEVEEVLPAPADEQEHDDALPTKVATPAAIEQVTSALVERFAAFGDATSRLPNEDIGKVIRELGHGAEAIQQAIDSLSHPQLEKVLLAGKSPAGYLKRMLVNAIEEFAAMANQPAGAEARTGAPYGKGNVDKDTAAEDSLTCAKRFALYYNDDEHGLDWKPLIPVFPAAIVMDPKYDDMLFVMEFAFEHDQYFRKLPLLQSARTFVKQFDTWLRRYNKAAEEEETEDGEEGRRRRCSGGT